MYVRIALLGLFIGALFKVIHIIFINLRKIYRTIKNDKILMNEKMCEIKNNNIKVCENLYKTINENKLYIDVLLKNSFVNISKNKKLFIPLNTKYLTLHITNEPLNIFNDEINGVYHSNVKIPKTYKIKNLDMLYFLEKLTLTTIKTDYNNVINIQNMKNLKHLTLDNLNFYELDATGCNELTVITFIETNINLNFIKTVKNLKAVKCLRCNMLNDILKNTLISYCKEKCDLEIL